MAPRVEKSAAVCARVGCEVVSTCANQRTQVCGRSLHQILRGRVEGGMRCVISNDSDPGVQKSRKLFLT